MTNAGSQISDEQRLTILSDAAGHFSFDGLLPGKYRLAAAYGDHRPQAFLAHGPFSTAIVVGPGLDAEHIVFPLQSDGRLSGTIVDEEGDPVKQATVYLLRKAVWLGQTATVAMAQTTSSARGLYHFSHLLPGIYYVAVAAQPWYANTTSEAQIKYEPSAGASVPSMTYAPPPALVDVAYPVTYSGDVTNANAAEPITIVEGAAATCQIVLRAVPSLHLFLEGARAEASQRPMIQLRAVGPGETRIAVSLTNMPLLQGQNNTAPGTEVSGIAPGRYEALVQLSDDLNRPMTYPIDITLSTSGPLNLPGAIASKLHGSVSSGRKSPLRTGRLLVMGKNFNQLANVTSDGSFQFDVSMPPGLYHLFLIDDPALTIVSVQFGDATPVQGNHFTVPNSSTSLNLHLTTAPSSSLAVSGIALTKGKPVPAAMVLLVPRENTTNSLIGRDQTDSDGTFTIPSMPPGHYLLLALTGDDDQLDNLEYRTPAVLAPYLAQAQPVDVPTNETLQIQTTEVRPAQSPH